MFYRFPKLLPIQSPAEWTQLEDEFLDYQLMRENEIPTNAAEERVFSLINKNKTKFRPSLQLEGTLSSIITIKLACNQPCHAFEPPSHVLETAKTATMVYNKAHSRK